MSTVEETMTTSSEEDVQPIPSRREIKEAVIQLVEANRARCLWFAAPDYLPTTDAEAAPCASTRRAARRS